MPILADEITNDPTGKGYAALLPDKPGRVADLLNALTESKIKSRMITSRTILAECDLTIGTSALEKLAAASVGNETIKIAVHWLSQESGIDIGHPNTSIMLDAHVSAGILTLEESDALKALALQPASRAEVLGLPYVTEEMLRNR